MSYMAHLQARVAMPGKYQAELRGLRGAIYCKQAREHLSHLNAQESLLSKALTDRLRYKCNLLPPPRLYLAL